MNAGSSTIYDDYLLLRAIAHHVATLLVLSRQTEERRAAVGLEALHRFSAFCLHDLRNLTAGRSLVVQNGSVHGQDPAFQQSAMKTVAGTVRKMTALILRCAVGRRRRNGRSKPPVSKGSGRCDRQGRRSCGAITG